MCRQCPQSLFTMLKLAGRFILILMKIPYNKQFTCPKDLISLLKSRGLSIANEQEVVDCLTNIGYYRLSAYCYPLLDEPKTNHLYKSGSTFDLILNMYRFDRKLRLLILNEIEKVEVAIRSAMNNWTSDGLNDVFWMTDAQNFNNSDIFAKRLSIIRSELDKTGEEFIVHFKNKYSNPFPPAWMIAEIAPFGVLCSTFNNLKYKSIKKKVANCFGLSVPVFSSWMVVLVSLRNLCGHHNRT